jgi:hypothetical protein
MCGVRQAAAAAAKAKGLTRSVIRSFQSGYVAPAIAAYIVAYDGPARMETVYEWIKAAYSNLGVVEPSFSADQKRIQVPSPSLDGVYVLGRGFCNFGNTPYGFLRDGMVAESPHVHWEVADCQRGSLLYFFLNMTVATNSVEGAWLNPLPYLQGFAMHDISFRP